MKGYLTHEEAIKKYGKEMMKKMEATGFLTGITGIIKDGVMYIPASDYRIAYKAAKGKKIHWAEWD